MKTDLFKALMLIGGAIPVCTALAIVLFALVLRISPESAYLTMLFPVILVGVLPWSLLTYIFASKRFGFGWNWVLSVLASFLSCELGRIALSNVFDIKRLTNLVRNACSTTTSETFDQLQLMSTLCGINLWVVITVTAFIRTITAGALLTLIAWAKARYAFRTQAD